MDWNDIYKALSLGAVGIIGAVSAFVIRFLDRRTKALDNEERRTAAFDAASTVEERARKASLSPATKLDLAVRLANESTPSRIKVEPQDIEAALPRVRASLADPAALLASSMRPPPPAAGTQAEGLTHLPYPPSVPRDTSREKAPLR